MNAALEGILPERRLFLRSDTETRFIRLRPLSQAIGIGGTGLVLCWSIIAAAILMMDSIGSGSAREQSLRAQSAYEARLDLLSHERDQRAAEAAKAEGATRFCMGAAWRGPKDRDLDPVLAMVREVKALGLEFDGSKFGMGTRGQRFSMIVNDGVVEQLNVEAPGEYRVSSAEHMLGQL